MSSVSGYRGVCAVPLSQFIADGAPVDGPQMLSVGMMLRWQGQARRLDGGTLALLLERPQMQTRDRGRVRDRLNRLGLAPLLLDQLDVIEPCPDHGFTLTDGLRVYAARLVNSSTGPLAVFDPVLPMLGTDLWISAVSLAQIPRLPVQMCGIVAGTRIETPLGCRAVEDLRPGDPVLTRDNGAQPLVWRAETVLSGAELYLYPGLRPMRVSANSLPGARGDLLVAPSQGMLLTGLEPAFNIDEALVRAADLGDLRGIRRDFSAASVRYVHLLLPRPDLVLAEGLPVASFQPAQADPVFLRRHARSLERAWPGASSRPERCGLPVHRWLSTGEAAIAVSRRS